MNRDTTATASKVAEVTFLFWVIKIFATTLGETGGDALSMTMNLGYAVSTAIFGVLFVTTVAAQMAARKFHSFLYWTVIIATTTVGKTLGGFRRPLARNRLCRRIARLLALLMLTLGAWRLVLGSVAVDRITSWKAEIFDWVTIVFSNTLGTALGDFFVDDSGFGFIGAAAIFAGYLALIAAAYFFTKPPRALLFWSAFILTRPLGATLGDLLTKSLDGAA